MKIRKLHEVIKQDKICKACDKLKPYTEYNVCKYTMGGLKHRCRECMTEYSRSYSKVSQAKVKIAPDTKVCKECECSKDIIEFRKDHSSADGYRTACIECMCKKQKTYKEQNKDLVRSQKKAEYEKNRDRYIEWRQTYYAENKEEILRKSRVHYYANQDRILEYNREYSRRNSKKRSRRASERDLRLKREQPPWVESYKEEIENIYKTRQELDATLGKKHHVDHIIPLTHSDVCGLHVPWNMQVLTQNENCSKNNQFDGTYDNEKWREKLWHSTLA